MVVCGNVFSKVKQRVIIRMINDQHELDFAEFEDPDNKINQSNLQDFVVIQLDGNGSRKINDAYVIESSKKFVKKSRTNKQLLKS